MIVEPVEVAEHLTETAAALCTDAEKSHIRGLLTEITDEEREAVKLAVKGKLHALGSGEFTQRDEAIMLYAIGVAAGEGNTADDVVEAVESYTAKF